MVDISDIPNISKFGFLKSLVEGEAKNVIEGLPIHPNNYKTACDILKECYGIKDRIVFDHVQELLAVSVPSSSTRNVPGLWKLYTELQKHMCCLEALDITGAQYGVILTIVVLPQDPRLCISYGLKLNERSHRCIWNLFVQHMSLQILRDVQNLFTTSALPSVSKAFGGVI